ncbi:MAG TPA: hypothetical protein VFI31_30440 [Pirellulales bacterium]|nr:hypothetical protein [Pirellulales bacterium]
MDFAGVFETHFTIGLDGASGIDALRDWGQARGLKCLHILLDRGASPSQPMLTHRGSGDLASELRIANDLSRQLEASGFRVTRIKIEAACTNRDVPATDAEAMAHPELYFEHHVKLLLEPQTDMAPLASLAQEHGAHLSRNALTTRPDGREERFVTQRCCLVGRQVARRRLDALLNSLKLNGYPVLDIEEEFVVLDTNGAIDAGWIEVS